MRISMWGLDSQGELCLLSIPDYDWDWEPDNSTSIMELICRRASFCSTLERARDLAKAFDVLLSSVFVLGSRNRSKSNDD